MRVSRAIHALLLAVLPAAACGQAWNFSAAAVTSKGAAVSLATSDPLLPQLSTATYLSAGQLAQLSSMFNDWAAHFGQQFTPLQESQAMYNFLENMQLLFRVNSDATIAYWLSGNQFSHLTFDQFRKRALGKRPVPGRTGRRLRWSRARERRLLQALPAAVDWVQAGKVTPVKDQDGCAGSWAFAATAALESMSLLSDPTLSPSQVSLSEQQLLDCCNSTNACYVSQGCDGGLADEGIAFAASQVLTAAAAYPYVAHQQVCNDSLAGALPGVQPLGGAVRLPDRSEAAMMQAVASQPVVVYFAVTNTFRNYGGGVYTSTDCGSNVNHAMLVVGYNTSGADRYWILKNSWGTSWGERGYARVRMSGDGNGTCGMYLESYQAPRKLNISLSVEKPNPSAPPPPRPPSPPDPCACVFPFVYKNITYNACTTLDSTGGPWCMVSDACPNPRGQTSYSQPPEQPWVYCPSPPPAPPTPPGIDSCACLPSFTYKNHTFTSCTLFEDDAPWCIVSANCTTYFGTAAISDPPYSLPYIYCTSPPGQRGFSPPSPPPLPGPTGDCQCSFPFTYKGLQYNGCTTVDIPGQPWGPGGHTCSHLPFQTSVFLTSFAQRLHHRGQPRPALVLGRHRGRPRVRPRPRHARLSLLLMGLLDKQDSLPPRRLHA